MSLGSSRELGKERQRETRRAGQPKLVTQGASDLQADVPVRLSFVNRIVVRPVQEVSIALQKSLPNGEPVSTDRLLSKHFLFG